MAADILDLLTRADEVWSLRHRARPATDEYLVHLAAAIGGEALDRAAEVERLRVRAAERYRWIADLVTAVTGRWNRNRDVGRQVADALAEVDSVRAFLLSLRAEPHARAG